MKKMQAKNNIKTVKEEKMQKQILHHPNNDIVFFMIMMKNWSIFNTTLRKFTRHILMSMTAEWQDLMVVELPCYVAREHQRYDLRMSYTLFQTSRTLCRQSKVTFSRA